MNNDLFEYGIHTENSDVRAHVSVCDRTIYVFKTRAGIDAITPATPRTTACQPGVKGITAAGWLVPIATIADLRPLRYHSWPHWHAFMPGLSTSEKGKLAVQCVTNTMRIGQFPFWIDATEDDRESVQVKGTDIVIFCRKRVQVKCDWRSGETGNLFL